MVVAVLMLVALAVAVGVCVVRGRSPGAGSAVPQDRPGPVLLVPGYGGDAASLESLRRALQAEGRTVEVVPAVDGGTGDLVAQAEHLAQVARSRTAGGAPSVDVVGYSAGGVVARIWAQRLGGDRIARRIVTLGSPHHGTDVAGFALGLAGDCPLACRQLAPGSSLLTGLDDTVPGPVWTSIWTSADTLVTPPESARLGGAVDVPLQQVCPDARTTHGGLPADPLVIGLVETALGAVAPAEAPGPGECAALRSRGQARP